MFVALGAWAMGNVAGGDSVLGLAAAGHGRRAGRAIIVALPALRLQGLYLALVTFGFAVGVADLLFQDPHIYGEGNVSVGRLEVFGVAFGANEAFFVLCAIVFALVGIGVLALKRGAFGRRLAAMRDSQAACATLGLDVRRTKLAVFGLSASIAGLAGALFGGLNATAWLDIQFEPINNIVLLPVRRRRRHHHRVRRAHRRRALRAAAPACRREQPKLAGLVFAGVAAAAIGLGRQPNGLAGMLYERLPGLAPRRARTASKPSLEGATLAPQV